MKHRREARPGRKPDLTPKIPAFKFSTKNKTDAAYRDRLHVLKEKYGVRTTLRSNAKLTPQAKSAITRATRKVIVYLNPANRFVFVPAEKKTLSRAKGKGTVHRDATTTKGAFVQLPESRHRSKVSLNKSGELTVKTGSLVSRKKAFKTTDVLRDPKLIEREAKKRGAKAVFVSVKGLRGKRRYSAKAFSNYLKHRLKSTLREQVKEGRGLWKNRFQVEFVSMETKPRKGRK